MESKFSSELVQKVQEYCETQFDKSILPSLMGIILSFSFLTKFPFRLCPYPKPLKIL